MVSQIDLDGIYQPSEDIVARYIEGELIIVPLTAGIGNLEDEIYTLNPTGLAIWEKLDGKRTLNDVAGELSSEFEAQPGEIEQDVRGIVAELASRRMLVLIHESSR